MIRDFIYVILMFRSAPVSQCDTRAKGNGVIIVGVTKTVFDFIGFLPLISRTGNRFTDNYRIIAVILTFSTLSLGFDRCDYHANDGVRQSPSSAETFSFSLFAPNGNPSKSLRNRLAFRTCTPREWTTRSYDGSSTSFVHFATIYTWTVCRKGRKIDNPLLRDRDPKPVVTSTTIIRQ